MDFSNSRSVEIDTGTLRLQGASESTGSYEIAEDAVLEFAAGTHILDGVVISGVGTALLSGGTLEVADASSVEMFVMSGGTLTGTATLTVTGAGAPSMDWQAGTMTGTGELLIASTATLTISGSATRYLQGGWTLTNEGTGTW